MTTVLFLRPRLTGPRFEGRAVPLEILGDLAVLEEMLVEVAKLEFLKQHPGRKRSPRGFTEGIEFKLTGMEDGSAVLVISLCLAAATLFPPENQAYLECAREAVVGAIAAAEQNERITDYLPEKTLCYFDRMGRSLREGEAIEFSTARHPEPVRLTKETRRKLILASSELSEVTEEIAVRGRVPEADQERRTIQIQLVDGRRISAPLSPLHSETILAVFNGYTTGMTALFQGIGRFDRDEKLLYLDAIEHVTILDPLDVRARLDELELLRPGWLEGEGVPLSAVGAAWLSEAFDYQYQDDIPLPYLYPTADGGIQAEWSLGSAEATLTIDLATHRGQWHLLDVERGTEETRELDLNGADDWKWLVERVGELAGGAA